MSDRSIICRTARVFSDSGFGRRHASGCSDCQKFFVASMELDDLLRASAAENTVPAPTGLERRISAAVRMSAVGHPSSGFRLLASGVGLAVIAVSLVFFRAPDQQAGTAETPTLISRAQLAQAVESAGARVWGSLVSAGEYVGDNSLNEEWGLVYSSARVALRFLEQNFVPEAFRSDRPQRNG